MAASHLVLLVRDLLAILSSIDGLE